MYIDDLSGVGETVTFFSFDFSAWSRRWFKEGFQKTPPFPKKTLVSSGSINPSLPIYHFPFFIHFSLFVTPLKEEVSFHNLRKDDTMILHVFT